MADSPPTSADLGRAIRALRKERARMSQEKLAHAAGITKNYVSGIELGQRNPTWAVLAAIATAFEISLAELVERAEEERNNSRA